MFRYEDARWWTEEAALSSPTGGNLGYSVAVDGDLVLAGAYRDNLVATQAGSVGVFRFNGNQWLRREHMVASNPGDKDYLGAAVSLSGGVALVGAYQRDGGGVLDAGSAIVFPLHDLVLDASPNTVVAGDPLTLTTCGGLPFGAAILAVVDINGSNVFRVLFLGMFDADGRLSLPVVSVPSGLAGLQLGFLSVGVYKPGRNGFSNEETVVFN